MSKTIEILESVIGKNPDALLHEPVYQVTESEVLEFARLLAAPAVERQDGSALMKIAADLANRHPLRQLYLVCEHQGRINTDSLHEHLDKCGDLLAGIALDIRRAITSPPAPVEVVLNDPIPITDGTARLMEAYRLGEFSLEGGSPTVEAMSCASYDNHSEAIHDNDFDSYTAGYQAAMYEEGKSLLGLIARLDKVKEMNQ